LKCKYPGNILNISFHQKAKSLRLWREDKKQKLQKMQSRASDFICVNK